MTPPAAPMKLTPAQWRALEWLAEHGPVDHGPPNCADHTRHHATLRRCSWTQARAEVPR